MKFIPSKEQISLISPATSIACCLLSITHGPEIRDNGKWFPKLFLPIFYEYLGYHR